MQACLMLWSGSNYEQIGGVMSEALWIAKLISFSAERHLMSQQKVSVTSTAHVGS